MPSSFVFIAISPTVATGNGLATDLNAGSSNDTAEEIFRKHFNPAIKSYEPGWNALIGAISAGDEINFENAQNAVDQLWIHSASGIFLDRRAADQGVVRPESVGLSDDVFRRLTIKTTTKKLVTQALLEVMEVFYGANSTRANETSIDGPFALADGWDLLLSIDGEDVVIPFVTEDFTTISSASAREVAAVITRWLELTGSQAYAVEVVSATTGLSAVKIYSGSLGLSSSVQITGGRAQNALQFPTLLTTSQAANTWVVTLPSRTIARFAISGATTTDLTDVVAGDYVNIYGAAFNAANLGSFPIYSVDVRNTAGVLKQYFEIELEGAVAQGAVVQATALDLVFFRPTKATINANGDRAVIVAQTAPGEVTVQMPATTSAVTRGPLTGAYLNTNTAVEISTVVRDAAGLTTIVTATNHGLSAGGQVFLDGIISDGVLANVTSGDGATTSDASVGSFLTSASNMAAWAGTPASLVQSILLSNGDVLGVGGMEMALGVEIGEVDTCHRLRVSNPTVLADTSIQYDYAWIATANAVKPVHSHRLALFTDASQGGNVLSCGGTDVAAPFADSYVYNVTANTWSANIPLATARYHHTATTLNDGRVLVTGGYSDFAFTSLASAELFTPVAADPGGSWATTTSMALARAEHQAIKLANGKVLIIGGGGFGYTTETCELFDPATNTFSGTGPMGHTRTSHEAVMLPNNRVFVWGGFGRPISSDTNDAWLRTAEIYDGATGRWSPAVSNLNRVTIGDDTERIAYLPSKNQVAVIGRGRRNIDLYDVATGQWMTCPTLIDVTTDAADGNSLVALTDYPIVVLMGGQDAIGTSIAGAALYQAADDYLGAGGLNNCMLKVASIVSPTSFTVETPNHSTFLEDTSSDGQVLSCTQPASATGTVGPYIYDPDGGFAVTGTETATTAVIYSGTKYATVGVTAGQAANFADEEGWLVFGFGTANEVGPIRYVGRASDDALILDYAAIFPEDLPIGTSVILLDQKGPFVPEDAPSLGSFYATDSSAGRVAASDNLDAIFAGGLTLIKSVVYPGDIGLGAAGHPATGQKISDKISVWSGNDIDAETLAARGIP